MAGSHPWGAGPAGAHPPSPQVRPAADLRTAGGRVDPAAGPPAPGTVASLHPGGTSSNAAQ